LAGNQRKGEGRETKGGAQAAVEIDHYDRRKRNWGRGEEPQASVIY